MSTPLDQLNLLFRTRYRAWSETAQMPEPGLRAIPICGSVLRLFLSQGNQESLFDQMRDQLPADAVFMDLDGQMIRVRPTWDCVYQDMYCVIVASNEWAPIERGGTIPELTLKFHKQYG